GFFLALPFFQKRIRVQERPQLQRLQRKLLQKYPQISNITLTPNPQKQSIDITLSAPQPLELTIQKDIISQLKQKLPNKTIHLKTKLLWIINAKP
ncbi:MAG: hypothetical protein AAGJ35_11535, partial [Myxococcota bacterium]